MIDEVMYGVIFSANTDICENDPYEGIARGINAGGELLVERADGTVEEVNSGEVSVRGLYSYV